ATEISASASAPPIWNSRRKTSEVLRKLSLNAAKNWVQNRGAKRRVISRDEDMAFPLVPTGTAPRCATKRWFAPFPLPASETERGEGWGRALRAPPLTKITSLPTPLSPPPARGAGARFAPTASGAAARLRDDILGKRTTPPP